MRKMMSYLILLPFFVGVYEFVKWLWPFYMREWSFFLYEFQADTFQNMDWAHWYLAIPLVFILTAAHAIFTIPVLGITTGIFGAALHLSNDFKEPTAISIILATLALLGFMAILPPGLYLGIAFLAIVTIKELGRPLFQRMGHAIKRTGVAIGSVFTEPL